MAGELYTLSGMGRTFQLYCLLGDENQRGGGERKEHGGRAVSWEVGKCR